MIAEGIHAATILAFALRSVEVRGRKTPVLDITANVKDHGPVRGSLFLNDDDAGDGKPSSRERSFATLRKLGWDGEPDGRFTGLVGKPVSVTVEHKTSNGKTYANAKYFNPPITSSVDPEAAKALFGATVKPLVAVDDTDIPF